MKNIFTTISCIALVTLFFATSSCDKERPTSRKLKGTWELKTVGGTAVTADEAITFEFKSGGNFESSGADSSALTGEISGDWAWVEDKTELELSWRNDSSRAYFEDISLTKEVFTTKPFGASEVWVLEKE